MTTDIFDLILAACFVLFMVAAFLAMKFILEHKTPEDYDRN